MNTMLFRPINSLRPFYAKSLRMLGGPSLHRGKAIAAGDNLEEERQLVLAQLKEDLPTPPKDGPERDLVNFPRRPRPENPGKVRMGVFPDEWFQIFYKKTGVTGPYVFGTGLITFLLSKEYYVFEEEFSTGVSLVLIMYVAVKKFGPAMRKFMLDSLAKEEAKMYEQKAEDVKSIEDSIAAEKKSQWHATGQSLLMEAKRENVHMQLEAEYRRRMMNVYSEVKKRLDYHLDIHNTTRKMQQNHMADWVVSNVMKSITPQQEKEALQKCIEDLRVLSSQAH